MALMYMAATAMPYGGSYLMHARTKGSKNGVSNTPGYIAVGERAEGRLVNGRYVYDNTMTNSPKVLAKRAQNRYGYAGSQMRYASSAARGGNYGTAARYVGNAARSTARTAVRNVSSAARTAAQNVSRTASRAANNVSNWATGDYARNQLQIARNANDREGMEYWQKQYDRTLPGIIDKVKEVGSRAWSSIKTGARNLISRGSKFLSGVFGNVRSAVGRAASRLASIAGNAWSSVKRAGGQALQWGGELVRKAVGAAKIAGRAIRTGVENAADFVTGNSARNRLNSLNESNASPEAIRKAEQDYANTLPGRLGSATAGAATTASNVSKAASSALQTASKMVGGGLKTVGQAVTTAGGQVIQTVVDGAGQAYQLISDGAGNIVNMIGGGSKSNGNFTPHFTLDPTTGETVYEREPGVYVREDGSVIVARK